MTTTENAITNPKPDRQEIPDMETWPTPPEGLVWDDYFLPQLLVLVAPERPTAGGYPWRTLGEVFNSSKGWEWRDLTSASHTETPQPTFALAAQALVDAHTPKVG